MNPSFDPLESICIKGARIHNLRNIDVIIPRDQFTVITGPSGSGKSSLAFDTVYAEGQRRYIESLSVYAKQFIDQVGKSDVDDISGLSPTISIEQRTTSYNPRSTVGTVTEIYDYLRLLYARVSKPYCWNCHRPIAAQSPQQIVESILKLKEGTKFSILAPIVKGRKGEHKKDLHQLRQRGFLRVRINGQLKELSEEILLEKKKKNTIEVYIDRLILKGDKKSLSTRLSDSIDLALKIGDGSLIVEPIKENEFEELLFSEKFACLNCNISYPDPEPRIFSFNSPAGACETCDGLGYIENELAQVNGEQTEINEVFQIKSDCPDCKRKKLKKESLNFYFMEKNIFDLCNTPIEKLSLFFSKINLGKIEFLIAEGILKEISSRLEFLVKVGAGYLSLNRPAKTLSGGEAQRIRLATQIGSSLVGVTYVLDEPSIGLHPRDHQKLLATLSDLKKLGNTVIVVEHDKETIENADWVIDLGPGAGTTGGDVVAAGSPKQIRKNRSSLTGKYLSGSLKIPIPNKRRPFDKNKAIKLTGLKENNLKNLSVDIPVGLLTCITGVSGSGKSSLVINCLYKILLKEILNTDYGPIRFDSISGANLINKVIDIDQSPIGKTPRSNPATYTGIFSLIRDLFSKLPEAQIRGYKPGRFSFNVKGGRCESCEGGGVKKVEMHFLPDTYVECDTCHGKRYNRETLEILYKGKSISDVLETTISDALLFFNAVSGIKNRLKVLSDVGLGYLRLGQTALSLSGGEAQRLKLSRELSKKETGKTLYILDEPSTGLHFDDISKLVRILQLLVDSGNTVIVIEHNQDILKVADYIIDLGPEGGLNGGEIVSQGTPEKICKSSKSHTGRFLKPYLV